MGTGERRDIGCCHPEVLSTHPSRAGPQCSGRVGSPPPRLPEASSAPGHACSRSRLGREAKGGELAAHGPGPGSEMGQQTRTGRRGSGPQGGDRGATGTEITMGNKQRHRRATDSRANVASVCTGRVHGPQPGACPDSRKVRRGDSRAPQLRHSVTRLNANTPTLTIRAKENCAGAVPGSRTSYHISSLTPRTRRQVGRPAQGPPAELGPLPSPGPSPRRPAAHTWQRMPSSLSSRHGLLSRECSPSSCILRHRPPRVSPQALETNGIELGHTPKPLPPHPPGPPPPALSTAASPHVGGSLRRGFGGQAGLSSNFGSALLSCVNLGRLLASLYLSLLVWKKGCHLLHGTAYGVTEALQVKRQLLEGAGPHPLFCSEAALLPPSHLSPTNKP